MHAVVLYRSEESEPQYVCTYVLAFMQKLLELTDDTCEEITDSRYIDECKGTASKMRREVNLALISSVIKRFLQ